MMRRRSIPEIITMLRTERDGIVASYDHAIAALTPLALQLSGPSADETPSNGHSNGHTNGAAKPEANGRPLPKRGLLPLLVGTLARVGSPMTAPELRDALGRKAPKRASTLNQTLLKAVDTHHIKRDGTRGKFRYSIPS